MKAKLPLILILANLLILPVLNAKTFDNVTGQDWLSMSREEKGLFIFKTMEVIRENGVPLNKTPDDYTALIDSELMMGPPAASRAYITNILSSIVYETEPACREALNGLRKQF